MIQDHRSVSVIMSVYNAEKYVGTAIESILNQSFKNFEFIIINDGSTDKSSDVIRSFEDERITFIDQQNKGLGESFNLALKTAKGKYIAITDPDDMSHIDRLKHQFEYLENYKECVCLATDKDIIDDEGNYIYTQKNNLTKEELSKQLPVRNPFTHSSLMIRKDTMLRCGGYKKELRYGVDAFALIDLQKFGELHILDKPLCIYRLRPGAASSNKSKKLDKKLIDLRTNYYKYGKINKEKNLAIEIVRNSIITSPHKGKSNYHFLVGSAYFAHTDKRKIARQHFLKSIKYKKLNSKAWLYFFLSILPYSFICVLKKAKRICKKISY